MYLGPFAAGGPFEMTLSCGGEEIIYKDICIGDVWVAGGQSNMEFSLRGSLHGREETAAANFEWIRYYHFPRIAYAKEDMDNANLPAEWKVCTSDYAGDFSAVAYHFAKNVHQALNIPIGIIGCNWGGTSAACWMSEKYLREDEQLGVYLEEYYAQIKNVNDEEYNLQNNIYNQKVQKYIKGAEEFKATHPAANPGFME